MSGGARQMRLVALLALGGGACKSACTHQSPPSENGASMSAMESPLVEPRSPELASRLKAALEAHGAGYRPRTHHLREDGAPIYTNRLVLETSPYLLQHAHNPVDWYPWGAEAFETARRLGRPVLLSVGYSTCHWCHVMEEESFEDPEIAGFINTHFVAIKVDREERPDVDGVYMSAVQAMTGSGGWPMTVLMTPDGKPFFGGTYFPPRDGARGARVGFLSLLGRLAEIYRQSPEKITATAQELHRALEQQSRAMIPQGLPRAEVLGTAARQLAGRFEPSYGGFGHAPKFPRPSTYELLLRYYRRTEDPAALDMVTRSLDGMLDGGLWDHVGGGFHRYSTDEQWLVPHFEKMLYDNAQLVSLLVETHQVTGELRYAQAARGTLDYVLLEMTSEEGAFYSATDADSEGEEGRFFVWTPGELEQVLGAEAARVVGAYYGVTPAGNFEGHTILNRLRPLAVLAKELGMEPAEIERRVAQARPQLYAAREKRPHPLRDDKVLTEWNAQMISAFAQAGWALDEPRYLAAAERAAAFLGGTLTQGGRLLRSYRAGRAKGAAVLEDYSFSVAARLDLFEATGKPEYLEEARRLQGVQDELFLDPQDGAYFATANDGEPLLFREKPSYDGAQPAGGSVAALNLLRLGELTQERALTQRAERIFQAMGAALERGAVECPKLACALDYYWDKPKQVIVVSTASDPGSALLTVLRDSFLPNRALIQVREGEALEQLKARVPLVREKRALDGKATAFVCTQQVCDKPTHDPEEMRRQLARVERLELGRKLKLPE